MPTDGTYLGSSSTVSQTACITSAVPGRSHDERAAGQGRKVTARLDMATEPENPESGSGDNTAAVFVAQRLRSFADDLTEDPKVAPSNEEIASFLELVPRLTPELDARVLRGLIELQAAGTGKKRQGVVNRVAACTAALDPTADGFRSALPETDTVDDEKLANFLSGQPLQSTDGRPAIRLAWLTALATGDRRQALGLERAWQKIGPGDLAFLMVEGDVPAAALTSDPATRARVSDLVESSLNDLDPLGFGALLRLGPTLLDLVGDGKLGRSLERLARAAPTVDRARNLLAVPLLRAGQDRHDTEVKALKASHVEELEEMGRLRDEAALEFGRQLDAKEEEIARLEGEIGNLRRRVGDLSSAAAAPSERMREQAGYDAVAPIGRLIRDLLSEGDERSLEKAALLEEAVSETGLVILDRPGDVTAFDAERHQLLTFDDCVQVEVLEASFGLRRDDGSIVILQKALVKCVPDAVARAVIPPKPVRPTPLEEEVVTRSDMATCAIDFGTSTVLASVQLDGGQIRVLPIGRGGQVWMPSVVGIADDGSLVVGEEAEDRVPESRLLVSVKSMLGNGDTTVLMEGPDGTQVSVAVDDAVEAILAEAIRRSREPGNDAEAFGAEGIQFHLSCPANWEGESRRRLTRIASGLGLPVGVLDVVDEPTAAGVSWIYEQVDRGRPLPVGRTLIVDIGGGTVDVAVIDVSQPAADGRPGLTVLAADGLQQAGDDLDLAIASEALVDQLPSLGGVGFDELAEGLQKQLRLTARDLKHRLTEDSDAETRLRGATGGDAPSLALTRVQLDELFRPQLESVAGLVRSVIRSAILRQADEPNRATVMNLTEEDLSQAIGHVLLAGGMSRIVALEDRLRRWFTDSTIEVDEDLERPRECSVVVGLGHDEDVSELNMHRPAFDIVAAYSRNMRPEDTTAATPIYEAFTRIIRFEDAILLTFGHGFPVELAAPTAREGWTVFLHFRSPEGSPDPIPFLLDGRIEHHLAAPLDHQGQGRFTLYANGRILLGSSKGRLRLLMRRWPILRGREGEARLDIQPDPRPTNPPPLDPGWWHGGE